MAFNRDRNSSGGDRGGFRSRSSFSAKGGPASGWGGRPSFGGRGRNRNDRGSVEMHDAICDNCGNSCQVPFRPTQGKPVFCSNCFENQKGGSESRFEGRNSQRSEERQMFSAVCADCGNECKVPFRPSSDKPVFCSNCFGEKKNSGGNGGGKDKFEELNSKLDKILSLLSPAAVIEEVVEKPVKVKAVKKETKVEKIAPVVEVAAE